MKTSTSNKQATVKWEKLFGVLKHYADIHGYLLNPHQPTLKREIDGLLNSVEHYGYFVCPCRLADVTGDVFRDKSITCPCAFHKRELKNDGFCKCELFVKPRKDIPGLVSTSIHRVAIDEIFNDTTLRLTFEKAGKTRGEIKIRIPRPFQLVKVTIEPMGKASSSQESYSDGIWFSLLEFVDKAWVTIEVMNTESKEAGRGVEY